MASNTKMPEWAPEGDCAGFACRVMDGVAAGHDGISSYSGTEEGKKPAVRHRRPQLTAQQYADGVLRGDRAVLGRAITLVESNAAHHIEKAQEVLKVLLPFTGHSIRVGITGVPGVDKSTFIETFGCHLIELGHKVAVLAAIPPTPFPAVPSWGTKPGWNA